MGDAKLITYTASRSLTMSGQSSRDAISSGERAREREKMREV
jgi:hypothetical protein